MKPYHKTSTPYNHHIYIPLQISWVILRSIRQPMAQITACVRLVSWQQPPPPPGLSTLHQQLIQYSKSSAGKTYENRASKYFNQKHDMKSKTKNHNISITNTEIETNNSKPKYSKYQDHKKNIIPAYWFPRLCSPPSPSKRLHMFASAAAAISLDFRRCRGSGFATLAYSPGWKSRCLSGEALV